MKLYVKYKVNSLTKIKIVNIPNEDYYYGNSISMIESLTNIINKLEKEYSVSNIEILDYSTNKLI